MSLISYSVSKVAIALVSPLGAGLAVGLAGMLLARRFRRTGTALAFFGFAWLWLWSTPAISLLLVRHLEAPYPAVDARKMPAADVIVVLGGGLAPPSRGALYPNMNEAADRVWHASRLFHAGKAPLIVATGGSDPEVAETSAAAVTKELLGETGVPESQVLLVPWSRTTQEDAELTAALLRERRVGRILLVTSALHMRRSLAEFERVGFHAIPAATDHTQAETAGVQQWLPQAEALEASGRAFKEVAGSWAMRWRPPARPAMGAQDTDSD